MDINREVDDLLDGGIIEYDHADDKTDKEFKTYGDLCSDDVDVDNEDSAFIDDNDDSDNGGVPILVDEFVETHGEDVEQPQEAFEEDVEETSRLEMLVGIENCEGGHKDNVPQKLFPTPVALSSSLVSTLIAQLGRATTSPSSSSRPLQYDAMKTIDPALNSRAQTAVDVRPPLRDCGVKRLALGPETVRPFVLEYAAGTSSSSPAIMGTRGINEDRITNKNKRKKVKKIVTTRVDGEIVGEMRNINSIVEKFAPNGLNDEAKVHGDDEGSSGSDDSRAKAPNDKDVFLRAPLQMGGTLKNPRQF